MRVSRFLMLSCICIASITACSVSDLITERIPPPEPAEKGIRFLYDNPAAREVYIAGQFNGWAHDESDRKLLKMKKNDKDVWEYLLPFREYADTHKNDKGILISDVYVEHGNRYQYKIDVDRNSWILDPNNRNQVDDGTGNLNSLLIVP